MKAAIMQPYFLPYVGYFQLINCVDVFVVYDNIEYTKKGWINRNRMLRTGKDEYFTLPLKKDSDFLHVNRRQLAETHVADNAKLLNRLRETYRRAPFFEPGYGLAQEILGYADANLFNFVHHSLVKVCAYLDIRTPLVVSSALPVDHTLKAEDKVLEICTHLGAHTYINPIGGTELYSKTRFRDNGLELLFLKPGPVAYPQFGAEFQPWLSVIDLIMFNAPGYIRGLLGEYTLIEN